MRWGWPHPKDWKIPQPIHARAESIDDPKKPFLRCVTAGQRGIVLVRTFNEAPDVPGPTVQHTITPGDAGVIGIAMIWKSIRAGRSARHPARLRHGHGARQSS